MNYLMGTELTGWSHPKTCSQRLNVSKWRSVTSGVPQGSVLGQVLFNIFISDIDSGIECTLSKFADDTKLSGAVVTHLSEGMPSRGTFTGLRSGPVNLMNFNKAKCKVLHLGWGNPQYQYRLRDEWIESSPAEEDLGILVNQKLDMSRQSMLAAQKANGMLGCIKRSVASRLREVILPLYFALHKTDMDLLEPVQRRAMEMIRGMEHLSYEERLRELGLLSLEKARFWGDLIAAFQYMKGLIRKMERDFLLGPVVTGHGGGENWNTYELRTHHTYEGGENWNRLPRKVVDVPSLEMFKVSVADNAKLDGEMHTSDGRAILQRDLDRLEEWASKNCMKFNNDKFKVLHDITKEPSTGLGLCGWGAALLTWVFCWITS
ncbi:hypothetical protein QYF61_024867 [Mycteria americana]|uniref:Rna-directed dna polymerase from mobile element jockey-like n=1 Tax=Mycteria americana TaxID=33587 RepID=A0AAN7S4I2_MYCAM|nr:hypothetical protein QYF61_024867 [Mycteria americana]